VPVDIRRELGLKEGDRVIFIAEEGKVRLTRAGSIVGRTAGVFKSHRRPLTAEELREAAERAMAEESDERTGS